MDLTPSANATAIGLRALIVSATGATGTHAIHRCHKGQRSTRTAPAACNPLPDCPPVQRQRTKETPPPPRRPRGQTFAIASRRRRALNGPKQRKHLPRQRRARGSYPTRKRAFFGSSRHKCQQQCKRGDGGIRREQGQEIQRRQPPGQCYRYMILRIAKLA